MKKKLMVFASILMCFGLYSKAESSFECLTLTEGVCQISSANDLVNFAKAVNEEGYCTLDAVLTADVDMQSASSEFMPIGTEDFPYSGSFDGMFHRIKNLAISLEQDCVGFFGIIQSPASISNLVLDESCSIECIGNYCAMIGQSKRLATGDIYMTNLGMEGTIHLTGYNGAGIIGNNNGNSSIFHMKNCYVSGTVTADGAYSGALTAYAAGNGTFENCWVTGQVIGVESEDRYFIRGFESGTITNCYCKYGTQIAKIEDNQIESGELCYLLNQNEVCWYQNLGEDAHPVLDSSHKKVYTTAQKRCDNIIIGEGTYTNDESLASKTPEHQYEDGLCTVCGKLDPSFLKLKDGFYQITNAEQLIKFMEMVNVGNPTINAQLTTDIDMKEYNEEFMPIGTSDHPYCGSFDGMFHKIKNLNISLEQDCVGFFGIIQSPANISNLVLDESCFIECIGNYCAMIGQSKRLATGDIYMTNLGMEGTIHLTGYNGAGIIGNNNGNSSTFHMKNCYVSGNVTADGAYSGALTAYAAGNGTFENCWVTGQVTGTDSEDSYFIRGFESGSIINCYSKYGTQVTKIDDSQMESGEFCYLLNQNEKCWYQNLGEDAHPVLDATHSEVFISTELRCDGQTIGEAAYTNDMSQASIAPDHEFEKGVCKNCGQKQEGFMEPDEEGFYNIADASQLVWFSTDVNSGDNNIKARLTADIDMADYCDKFMPIGNESSSYCGIFDGQGFSISNLNISSDQDNMGLFGIIQAPCTIKNLILDESCSISGNCYCGMIGQSKAGVNGNIYLTNLGNEGTVTGTGNNIAGIFGCCMNSSATIILSNCYVTGDVTGKNESGIFSGWFGNAGSAVNCWTTATVTGADSDANYLGRGTCSYDNCWSVNGTQCNIFTFEETASGSLCYKLNRSSFVTPTWYQNIGDDDIPIWDSTHGIVYKAGDIYADVHDETSFKEFKNAFLSSEQEYCETVIAEQTLIDQYADKIKSMEDFPTMEDFSASYDEFRSIKTSIESSNMSYMNFQTKVNEIIAYLEEHTDFEGSLRDKLTDYLTDIVEPSELYPYGTAPYIIEYHVLSAGDLQSEITKIETMLEQAIAQGFGTHANITSLLANADFSNSYEGWSGIVGNASNSPCAECKNSTCDFYQTLTNLKNGIYEIRVNGFFRPGNPTSETGNLTSTNYGAMFYANDIQNYLMTAIEDMISVTNAVDGENCYLTNTAGSDLTDYSIYNESDELIGFIPGGQTGLKFAVKSNRYLNRIMVNVTDGTLTVGFKCPGTGISNDVMDIANIQIYYHGTLEDATEELDATLNGMSARAQTLYNYIASEGADYSEYPNYSAKLREDLKSAIDAIANTTNVNEKYALIECFSDLFQQVYDSKKSFVKLMNKVESLTDLAAAIAPMLTAEEIAGINDTMETLIMAYINGTVTEDMINTDYVATLSCMPKQQNGIYQLSNGKDVVLFSSLVNSGQNGISAVLTSDIDMSGNCENFIPIGTQDNPYMGKFDGQGHKISNFVISLEQDCVGFFGIIQSPADISNLVLDESCSIECIGNYCAMIAQSKLFATGDIYMTNLGMEGTIHLTGYNGAGIIGNNNGNSSIFHMRNCYVSGTVTADGAYSGALTAYAAGNGTFENCWVTGQVIGVESEDRYFIRGFESGNIINCYSKYGTQVTKIDDCQVESGELCYLLNGDQSQITWYQNLGEDAHPVLDASHGVVKQNEDGSFYTEITSISDIVEKSKSQNIYNLMGQKVHKTHKGIYIIGGKKILVNK